MLRGNYNNFQCDIYDEKLAEIGTEITYRRVSIINEIHTEFTSFFKDITDLEDTPKILYDSSVECVKYSKTEGKKVFFNTLQKNREKDLKFGFSTIGPHRDNFHILLNSRDSKKFCSQGQCRALALSLKLAMSSVLYKNCKETLVFLVDDTVAELDCVKTTNFYPLIENKGQVFLAVPQGKSFIDNSFFSISL